MHLTTAEKKCVGDRVAHLESRAGVEIVITIVGKCDAYPEAPWKAFALFSALGALTAGAVLQHAVPAGLAFLGAGAVAALAAAFVPAFARLFVGRERRDAEARQYAAAHFLENGLSRTNRHNAVLMLIGLFERNVVILPDAGLPLASAESQDVIARMTPRLAAGKVALALHDGMDALEALLVAKGVRGGGGEIAQAIVEEKGA